jgi:hypothetical protein
LNGNGTVLQLFREEWELTDLIYLKKTKAIPLHATKALGGEEV